MRIQNVNKILIVALACLIVTVGIQNWAEPKSSPYPTLMGDPIVYSATLEYVDTDGSVIKGHIYAINKEKYHIIQIVCDYSICTPYSNLCVCTPTDYNLIMFCGQDEKGVLDNPDVKPNTDTYTTWVIKNSSNADKGHFNIEYHLDKSKISIHNPISIIYTDQNEECHKVEVQLLEN